MTWALDNGRVEVVRALLDKDPESTGDVLATGAREGKPALVELALARGGLKPEALTSALAATMNDKDKAAITEMLKKAGATPPIEVEAATLQSYVGKYKPETQGIDLTFTLNEGKLLVTPTGQQTIAMMLWPKLHSNPCISRNIRSFTVECEKLLVYT